eukprot:m.66275 g.66275  ORF g.66275 m.66275 type:complete len:179 (-) comp12646_c0_seq4:50-586(-)
MAQTRIEAACKQWQRLRTQFSHANEELFANCNLFLNKELGIQHLEHELGWGDSLDANEEKMCSMQLKAHDLARTIAQQLSELDVVYEKMKANTDNIEHLLDSGAAPEASTRNLLTAARALQQLYATETELRHAAWAAMGRCRTRDHQLVLLSLLLHSPYLDAHADRHWALIATHLAPG